MSESESLQSFDARGANQGEKPLSRIEITQPPTMSIPLSFFSRALPPISRDHIFNKKILKEIHEEARESIHCIL